MGSALNADADILGNVYNGETDCRWLALPVFSFNFPDW